MFQPAGCVRLVKAFGQCLKCNGDSMSVLRSFSCQKNSGYIPRILDRRKQNCGCLPVSCARLGTSASLYFSHPQQQSTVPDATPAVEPRKLTEYDLNAMYGYIKKDLDSESLDLADLSNYYFDGHGKAVRPMLVMLVSKAANITIQGSPGMITEDQLKVSRIAEMIHTASLVHDDVIDMSDARRGKTSVNAIWGQRKAILAGDFILAITSNMSAHIGNVDVTICLSQSMSDLVHGELMQLKTSSDEDERFAKYLKKCYYKTASLIAHTCKAGTILSGADSDLVDHMFQYGRNLGVAFQLIDDLIDFVSSQAVTGKPTGADLKLGLATAPVLFAARQFPELNPLIERRFSEAGDVQRTVECVLKSDGLDQTRFLAQQHGKEAIRHTKHLANCSERKALITMVEKVLNRLN